MNIPGWVRQELARFEEATEPHMETELSDALRALANAHPDMSEQDLKGYHAEWSAFLFYARPDEDSVWGTYFAPMMTRKRKDGTEFHAPDLKDIDGEVVAYWEGRTRTVGNSMMRARYADLVWDLKSIITHERPSYEFAQIAIDSYLNATEKQLFTMVMEGVGWLQRALNLSLSIKDSRRAERVTAAILAFGEKAVSPRDVGVWTFPFEALYGRERLTTPAQECKIVADLEKMLAKASGGDGRKELDPWAAQAAAERLARHYKRVGDPENIRRVIKAYGGAFEEMAREAGPMMAIAWLQPVAERYEQEGMKQEAERLQLVLSEKGKDIGSDMKTVSVSAEISKEEVEKTAEYLIGSADLNTSFVRVAAYFLPKASGARDLLKAVTESAPLLSMIQTVVFDSSGQPTARVGSVDQDPEGRLHMQLAQMIEFYQPFLVHVLSELRDRHKPTVDDILTFLRESPLFPAGRDELLREGLIAYEQEDFVKSVHVLVPQLEHVLRNFLTLIGIPSLKTVRRAPGIMDAKSMNDVLGDQRVRAALTEDLWRYLSVLYIDRKGLNLRNDLAHGLASTKTFGRPIADRVFHSLLALSLVRAKQSE